MADITYCGHRECTSRECMRHSSRIPVGVPVSMAMFDCPYLPVEEEPWNPVTNHQRIARMSVPEMAKWLWSMKTLCDCCEKQYICGVPDDEVTKGYCLTHVAKWLEQEVADG